MTRTVDGHVFVITPRVPGYLSSVYVDDNQWVEKGQLLVALDPTTYEVAVAQAKASLAQSNSTRASLGAGGALATCPDHATGSRCQGGAAES